MIEPKDIIINAIHKHAPTAINMHKINDNFIMNIDYDVLVDSILDDLSNNGYTIITTHQ